MSHVTVRRLAHLVVALTLFASLATTASALGSFTDDDGNTHEANIEAIAAEGITRGCNPPANTLYCPSQLVSRGAMAAFLVRALQLTDNGGKDWFSDDNGTLFEDDINKLAAASVTKGCNPPANDHFCPEGRVTRGAMAAFLVRAFGYTDNGGGNLFTDDDTSVFENDIDKLGTAGVTLGCNPPANTRFCPTQAVRRDQMASFLARALMLAPIQPGSFTPIVVNGSDNDVVDLQIPGDVPAVIDFTHDGSSNFIVWSLDSSLGTIDLLVNEIGPYDGRRPVNVWLLNPEVVRHLDITADGNWTVTARSILETQALTTSLNGSGDDVVRYSGGVNTLTSSHNGSSNFILVGYKTTGEYAGLIVNEIGAYSGTDVIPSGTAIVDIVADGNWSLDVP